MLLGYYISKVEVAAEVVDCGLEPKSLAYVEHLQLLNCIISGYMLSSFVSFCFISLGIVPIVLRLLINLDAGLLRSIVLEDLVGRQSLFLLRESAYSLVRDVPPITLIF